MGGVPDYAEPLSGWRAWLLVERDGARFLRSVVYPTLWQPRQRLHAECLRGRNGAHSAPELTCGCGIYAAAEPAQAADFLWSYGRSGERGTVQRVLGRTLLWGEVVECKAGWRAGCAYPSRLYLLSEAARDAGSTLSAARALSAYGVPVELLEASTREEALSALVLNGHAG
ncbi:MAG: hypothetical protein ACXVY8_05810 [Gaiellaceae bacterium]